MGNSTHFLMECMADALLQLMKNKPFEKITVNEITTLAGVGRATWFRHFKSKEEAITFRILSLWEEWIDSEGMSKSTAFTIKKAESFFAFNYSIRKIFDVIYKENKQSCLFEAFRIAATPPDLSKIVDCYENRFYGNGLFGLFDEWAKRNYSETSKQMTEICRHLLMSE